VLDHLFVLLGALTGPRNQRCHCSHISALFVVWTVPVRTGATVTQGVNTWWWGDDHLADLKVRLVEFNIPYFRIRTVALWSRDGKGIATTLWTGRSQVRIPAGTGDFSLFQNVQTSFGVNTAYWSKDTGILFRGYFSRGVKSITDFFVVPRLRMSGAMAPGTGKALVLPFLLCDERSDCFNSLL